MRGREAAGGVKAHSRWRPAIEKQCLLALPGSGESKLALAGSDPGWELCRLAILSVGMSRWRGSRNRDGPVRPWSMVLSGHCHSGWLPCRLLLPNLSGKASCGATQLACVLAGELAPHMAEAVGRHELLGGHVRLLSCTQKALCMAGSRALLEATSM